MKKKIVCLFSGCLVLGIVVFAATRLSQSGMTASDEYDKCTWGTFQEIDPSVGSDSLLFTHRFFDGSSSIWYLPHNSDTPRVLCSAPNCLHKSKKCVAYFPMNRADTPVDNVVQIGNCVYCVYLSDNANEYDYSRSDWQILRIDFINNTRQVVASFKSRYSPSIDVNDCNYYVDSVGMTAYAGENLWCNLVKYPRIVNQNPVQYELVCVDLHNGKTIAYTDEKYETVELQTFDSNVAVLYMEHSEKRMMSEEEFFGTVLWAQDFDNNSKEYYEYRRDFIVDNSEEYKYVLCNPKSGERTDLFFGNTVLVKEADVVYRLPEILVDGIYGNTVVLLKHTPDANGNYCPTRFDLLLYNLYDQTEKKVCSVQNGSPLLIAQGNCVNNVLNDGLFYFGNNITAHSVDIYCLNLETEECSYLYTDDSRISFRIYGAFDGGYWGKTADDQEGQSFYWISQEDFQKGDFSNLTKRTIPW